MNKILLICFLIFSTLGLNAQTRSDREEHREQIKALKIAYITQEMNMDPVLAQKFWPIYNNYESKKMDLHIREHVELENTEATSEANANEMLNEYLDIEKEEYLLKKQLFSDLKKILSAQDIIKLYKVESDFNKKLLKEYRERKSQGNKRN